MSLTAEVVSDKSRGYYRMDARVLIHTCLSFSGYKVNALLPQADD
jgi:hypothetical protein